jgi:DNA-directed RNA polymerase subunit RPC12/RpoP
VRRSRVPAGEVGGEVVVENTGPDLQEKVGAAERPPHLLLLDHTAADDPVDGTLGGGGGDRLAAAVALAVVRDLLSEKLDPARGSPFTPRAGMVPADPGDPSAWVVNEKLAYRQCAGCGSKVIADDRSRMNREWTPARTFYRRRGRHGTYDTAPGPHAPGTYACTECRAGTPAL